MYLISQIMLIHKHSSKILLLTFYWLSKSSKFKIRLEMSHKLTRKSITKMILYNYEAFDRLTLHHRASSSLLFMICSRYYYLGSFVLTFCLMPSLNSSQYICICLSDTNPPWISYAIAVAYCFVSLSSLLES